MLSSKGRNVSRRELGGSTLLKSEGLPIVGFREGRRKIVFRLARLARLDAFVARFLPSVTQWDMLEG